MFDPNSYRDADYGLDIGETFEPDDTADVALADTSLPHVMTVLGPIDPDELGVCLTREYLLQRRGFADDDPGLALDAQGQAAQAQAQALEMFAFSGGRGVVDARTTDLGRDAAGLFQLAQRVPLHIIATTGRRAGFHPEDPVDVEAMGVEFIRDLTIGMDGTTVQSGLIAVGMGHEGLNARENAAIRAAAMAHRATGAPVAIEVATPLIAMTALERLGKEGVDADRVILWGLGRSVSVDKAIAIAGSGAAVSFDEIGNGGTDGDARQARAIIQVFEAGYGDRVLISRHPRSASTQDAGGSSERLSYLLERFSLTLMGEGAEAGMVRQLLIENPRRALSIVPNTG